MNRWIKKSIEIANASGYLDKLNKKGLSQEKLARLADVSYNTIVKIESGESKNPTIQTMAGIAKALEVSLDNLMKE